MEIDPLSLFDQIVQALVELFAEYNITKSNLLSLGISTHRNSFLLWDRVTGNPYSNIICWNDKRSKKTAEDLNRSLFIRSIKTVVRAINTIWSPGRLQLLKDFKFKPIHKISKEKLKNSLFGTLETWIVWKLTRGKFHITDLSSVSTTSMYDISTNTWNYDLLLYFGIPFSILPRIVKTHGQILAVVNSKYFGFELNITALIADQQAASVGCRCIESGDTKLTLGSGTFIDITTGPVFNASLKHNCYPVVGWADKKKFCYIYEGNSSDTGVKILTFLKTEGLDINQPEILSKLIDDLPTNSEEYNFL
ncbi:putative glycerol kinase 5 [Thelohanellus kitauei]|uniref:Putative glycerol kinase 5 n=1 Tax=Thelohanellus kitauei TaxID=669202 RepID=A0A0C2MIU8_THEKT|nr:putative glycerol kinase 5 [Thelohanellus kitauei]